MDLPTQQLNANASDNRNNKTLPKDQQNLPPKEPKNPDPEEPKKEDQKKKITKAEATKKFMVLWFDQYFKMVAIVACVCLFVLSYIFILHSRVSNARSLRGNKYEQAIFEQEKLQTQLDYLVRAQKDKTNISLREIEDIGIILPSEPLTPQILTSVEDIAKSSNVTIEGIDLVILDPIEISKPDSDINYNVPEGVYIVEVTLNVATSPYDDLKSFVSNIEKNMRLMDVIALVYSPIGKNYNLVIRSYYFPGE